MSRPAHQLWNRLRGETCTTSTFRADSPNILRTVTAELTMRVRCPICGGQIDVTEDTLPAELRCAECCSSFAYHDSTTLSFTPKGAEQQVTYVPKRADSWTRPAQIGDYHIVQEIAHGGMGVIYKAEQQSLKRAVALKMIRSGALASPTDVARFRAEAEAAAKLDHPGIVSVHEVGEHNGHLYLSMAFVEGGTLADRIAGGPLPPKEAAAIISAVARAVQYAHDHGVIHRDLKPTNILMDLDGNPRVSDFGLAKNLGHDSELTVTGQVIGTPSFMSPEQARGEVAGPLADVYCLGATLYCLLTGRPPFHAATTLETIKQVIENDPASPRSLNGGIPRDLDIICLHCLEKEPAHRFSSAQEIADELDRYLRGEEIRCVRRAMIYSWYRWARRIERIREAGLVITGVGAWLMLGEVVALLSTITGVELLLPIAAPERRGESVPWIGMFLLDGLVIALAGWGVQRHRRLALVLTTGLVLVHTVLVPSICFGIIPFDMGGMLAFPGYKQILFVPFMTMTLLGGAALILAINAYRANVDRLSAAATYVQRTAVRLSTSSASTRNGASGVSSS